MQHLMEREARVKDLYVADKIDRPTFIRSIARIHADMCSNGNHCVCMACREVRDPRPEA